MSAGTLVVIVALIWMAVLAALLRLTVLMDQAERAVETLGVQGRPSQGSQRG